MSGRVIGIQVAASPGTEMVRCEEVRAAAGRGLEEDHHCLSPEALKKGEAPKPGRQITLIEAEAMEALRRDYRSTMEAAASRRNIVTRGVALNHLVGREFRVGEVRLRGVKLCEPCTHLAGLTGEQALPAGLVHRGGLRADILTDGVIRVGDEIRAESPA